MVNIDKEKTMGDWNVQPWANDEAVEWFYNFWKEHDFSVLINEIKYFDRREERYDSVRAASYLLQNLGVAYVWPSVHLKDLRPLLVQAISILSNMINPPDDSWRFLDMWGNSAEMIESVKRQIAVLETRLRDLAVQRNSVAL
jgi:hypothetical protein